MVEFQSLSDFVSHCHLVLQADLQLMENLIINSSRSDIALVNSVINHLITAGGKRIRPILLLTICKMFNCNNNDKIYVAAAVESIHHATLLHDDVIDESECRRGLNSANNIWGNKVSILVGDFLLTRAFQWVIQCKNLEILNILSQASYAIIHGEIDQMTLSNSIELTEQNYIKIIAEKTASLFAAACESAAVVAQATDRERQILKNFGYNFGIAFQITDDILDYASSSSDFGKKVGDDFYAGKVTLPVIIAYREADECERKFWRQSLVNKGNIQEALKYFSIHRALEKAMNVAKFYLDESVKCLSFFPDSPFKQTLEQLLTFVGSRSF